MQGSAQTSPSQDQQIYLFRTRIKESQLSLTSLLFHSYVLSATGAAAEMAELRKHAANDAKCAELGHPSPLEVESYEAWGKEVQ